MIQLSEKMKALLKKNHSRAHLLKIMLDDTTVYLTDASHDIVWASNRYLGGILERIPHFESNGEVKVGEASFVLSSTSTDVIALFYHNKWINRKIELRRAFFSDSHAPEGVIEIWSGLLTDKSAIESPKKASLTLKAASDWADFNAARGRKTNHNSQQLHHPGDCGFEFCGQVQNHIEWGQKKLSPQPIANNRDSKKQTKVIAK